MTMRLPHLLVVAAAAAASPPSSPQEDISANEKQPQHCEPRSFAEVFRGRHKLSETWDLDGRGDGYYVRVQDLLVLVGRRRLQPRLVKIDDICHKDMDKMVRYDGEGEGSGAAPLGTKPHSLIPDEDWDELWRSCRRKFQSHRMDNACPDIPGVVVSQPGEGSYNNPCQLPYRMVDGAHRLCRRKRDFLKLRAEAEAARSKLGAKEDSEEQYWSSLRATKDASSIHVFVLEHDIVAPLAYSRTTSTSARGWPTVAKNDTERLDEHMQHILASLAHEREKDGGNDLLEEASRSLGSDVAAADEVSEREEVPPPSIGDREGSEASPVQISAQPTNATTFIKFVATVLFAAAVAAFRRRRRERRRPPAPLPPIDSKRRLIATGARTGSSAAARRRGSGAKQKRSSSGLR